MRLLRQAQDGSFHLVTFTNGNVPPYAILSHTWGRGEDDEVTYKDLVGGTGKNKEGFKKLQFCGEQAQEHGLDHFWIDTCCIDKSSSSELTEAINSMFRWYQRAERCYVYLTDMSVRTQDDQLPHAEWASALRNSRWFTRGWTLQELLAPRRVEFYSRDGVRLGDKISLLEPIHEATGIQQEALHGRSLFEFSVEERMGWATGRQTTKEEDMAYALLGLCNVCMPLVYGEGHSNAMRRLRKEIADAVAPKTHLSTRRPFLMLLERNTRFVGREQELARLEALLVRSDGPTAKAAIIGLGGVGKTQLAIELVYRAVNRHQDCAVFWLPATEPESLLQAYLAIADKLAIPGRNKQDADVKQLVQAHLSSESAGRWLLVFDNADDMGMWMEPPSSGQGAQRLVDYLPKSSHGSILFTTRDRRVAVKLAGRNIVEVPEMKPMTAVELLQKCLVDTDPRPYQDDMIALTNQLTNLPLAIVQAAAYINASGISITNYLSLFTDQDETAIELLSEDFEDDGRYQSIKNPVATTWLISFERIRQHDALAADYLSFMACVEPKDIPQALLPAGPSRKKEMDAIGTLDAYSFITRKPAGRALDLHRLVHLATQSWLREHNLLDKWTKKTVARLEVEFPSDDHNNRATWRVYLPHVRCALFLDSAEGYNEARIRLARKFGLCLLSDGRFNEAEAPLSEVMQVTKRMMGDKHPDTLTSMADLALTYQNQGRWIEAEQLQVQVMETRKRVLGDKHPSTLISIGNLAATYRNQGRWTEAEQLEVQVMETWKRVLGDEHPDTLISMGNLALTYRNQGRWTEAEQLQVQVMETRKRVLGDKHPDTLISMGNLAATYRNQGRWIEAEQLEVQVMETRKRVLGDKHPSTLISMGNLAATYRNQGRWIEAEQLEVQVMETWKRVLGDKHPLTLISMGNLAATYRNQGRWTEAEQLQVQVIETWKRVLGDEHPDTLISMGNLAATYQNQGRWTEAEQLEVQVMETWKRVLGDKHPLTLISMGNLAVTYRNQGRWTEAEQLEVQVMETWKRVLGDKHPSTLISMGNLAATYRNQGRWTEAEQLEVQVIETRKRVLGNEYPLTLTGIANLTATY